MIVRSIKLVHFGGVADLQLRDFPEEGPVNPPLPSGASPGLVVDALRFAFLGDSDDAGRVISEGAGYAYVEVAFRLPRDAHLSIFRGVDRRGSLQVSLREEGGMRVTGGDKEVRARLAELTGAPLDRWEYATWIERPAIEEEPLPDATGLASLVDASLGAPVTADLAVPEEATTPSEPTYLPSAATPSYDEARERAETAVEALRRARRAEDLAARIETDFLLLTEFGGRLRRERTDVGVKIDQLVASRDRVRARLRRVNEYRDLLVKERVAAERRAVQAAPLRTPPAWTEWGLAACAAVLAAAFVYVSQGDSAAQNKDLATALGLASLASGTSYIAVASRRLQTGRFFINAMDADPSRRSASAVAASAPHVGDEWRAALRARFADLGDPDDPTLVDDLRGRLSAVDAEIAPLQQRLEALDDGVAAFDVEAGRASRETRRPPPAHQDGPSGLSDEDRAGPLRARIAALGDAVYHAAVERDALLAGGVAPMDDATVAVRDAFAYLSFACDDPSVPREALRRAGLRDEPAAAGPADDPCALLADAVAATSPARRLPSPEAERTPAQAPLDAETAFAILARDALAAASLRVGEDVTRLIGDVVTTISGRQFVLVQVGPRLELKLQGPGDAKPVSWSELSPDVRERLALALRLRLAEASLVADGAEAPHEHRHVVVMERPSTFADDAAIAAFVRSVAPRVVQVVLPPAPPAPEPRPTESPAPDFDPTTSPGPTDAPRPRRRRR